jgi:hypothetical protein
MNQKKKSKLTNTKQTRINASQKENPLLLPFDQVWPYFRNIFNYLASLTSSSEAAANIKSEMRPKNLITDREQEHIKALLIQKGKLMHPQPINLISGGLQQVMRTNG